MSEYQFEKFLEDGLAKAKALNNDVKGKKNRMAERGSSKQKRFTKVSNVPFFTVKSSLSKFLLLNLLLWSVLAEWIMHHMYMHTNVIVVDDDFVLFLGSY